MHFPQWIRLADVVAGSGIRHRTALAKQLPAIPTNDYAALVDNPIDDGPLLGPPKTDVQKLWIQG